MSPIPAIETEVRRTTADVIFNQLHADIVHLRLPPGTKLSESDIAKQSDVSRQPVREAFIRLSNMGLLTVRPQRATLVRKISVREALNANFIRTAVEVEVVRKACALASEDHKQQFEVNLNEQRQAAKNNQATEFHALDYEFHRQICIAGDSEFAFETIAENKSVVDRLGTLKLTNEDNMLELTDDHSRIVTAIQEQNVAEAIDTARLHLSRLKDTLKYARERYGEYFED